MRANFACYVRCANVDFFVFLFLFLVGIQIIVKIRSQITPEHHQPAKRTQHDQGFLSHFSHFVDRAKIGGIFSRYFYP